MAVTDCLLNCLREVCLERFHPNFTESGLTNCEQLSNLIVDDYSRFGVVQTDDRRRLYQLIHIIKSVQEDGVHCQHGASVTTSQQPACSKDELPDVTRNGVVPPRKIAAGGDADAGKCPTAPTRQFIKPISDDRGYRVQYKQQPSDQLRLHVTQETKVVTDNVDSCCGTPTFNCRKMLTFSDSDLHSDDGDSKSCDGASVKPSLQSRGSDSVKLLSPAAKQRQLQPPMVITSPSVASPRAFVIPAEQKPLTRHRSSGIHVFQTYSHNRDDQREFRDGRESRRALENGQPTKKTLSRNDSSRRHAYFPTAKIPAPEEPPTYMEQVYHGSSYNYGVPGSNMQLSDKVLFL